MMAITLPVAFSLAFSILSQSCLAFSPHSTNIPKNQGAFGLVTSSTTYCSTVLFSAKEATTCQLPTQSSMEKLEVIKLALKRPRGASIGVEYAPTTNNNLSDGDLSILSMQLRKAKCAAIWTSDGTAVEIIGREQESSREDFPGPVPVIYSGMDDIEKSCDGATAVVIEYGQTVVNMETLQDVGIIWKVNKIDELKDLLDMESNAGGVYLLSQDMLPSAIEEEDDTAELKELLSSLPKSVVTIAPLPIMLPENKEIASGKHYASLGISSLLLENACVGDEEDIKYSQFAIEGITKKSSSSFSMTGLTGSTNGHFGVSSHSGEVKWRRNE